MQHKIFKQTAIGALVLLALPAFAQKTKEAKESETQTIVITRNTTDTKLVIEVNGDKVKVNGKDAAQSKDVQVNVTTTKGKNGKMAFRNFSPGGGAWSFDMNDDGDMDLSLPEDENRAQLGINTNLLDEGVEVTHVIEGSAAAAAGLKEGDLLLKIDNEKIEKTGDVTRIIQQHKPGDKISITYKREGKEQTTTAELKKWKGLKMNGYGQQNYKLNLDRMQQNLGRMQQNMDRMNMFRDMPRNWNFSIMDDQPRLGLSIEDTDEGNGVKINDVDDESNAAKAGLKKDDVIVSIDGQEVKSTDDVTRMVKSNKTKSSFVFKIKRNGQTQELTVKMPRKLKTADL